MTTNCLSQEYFDETVLENEDVFDLPPKEAAAETIFQLYQQQKNSLTLSEWKEQQRAWWGVTLTHPSQSPQGQKDRKEQAVFRRALDSFVTTMMVESSEENVNNSDETTKMLLDLVEQIRNVFVRDEQLMLAQDTIQQKEKKQTHTSNGNPVNGDEVAAETKDEETEDSPVLLGNLFWQTSSSTNNENEATTNSTNTAVLLEKLALFASSAFLEGSESAATAMKVVLQIAFKSLTTVVGPKDVRRNRQEQVLRYFCLPLQGWDALFGATLATEVLDQQQQQHPHLQLLWLQLIRTVCQGHEPNKKHCNSKPILKALVVTLQQQQQQQEGEEAPDGDSQSQLSLQLVEATCQLITVLCRFDDFSSQATQGQATDSTGMVVSSAHSTVTTLNSMGTVTTLCDLLNLLVARQQKQQQNVHITRSTTAALLAVLQSLRSLAIQDEIVVRMVSTGLLEVLRSIFQSYCSISDSNVSIPVQDKYKDDHNNNDDEKQESLRLAILTALIGLYRNLSANDELKTTLCRSNKQSILGPLIASLQSLTPARDGGTQSTAALSALTKLQEHGCATLGSMALRQPQNAEIIVQEYQGHLVILKAMEMCQTSPLVQRQGALAVRNLASRASDAVKGSLLDAGAESVLRKAATLGAIDEAYAALRDLGCPAVLLQSNPETGKLERQAMFGEGKNSHFRPVYD